MLGSWSLVQECVVTCRSSKHYVTITVRDKQLPDRAKNDEDIWSTALATGCISRKQDRKCDGKQKLREAVLKNK